MCWQSSRPGVLQTGTGVLQPLSLPRGPQCPVCLDQHPCAHQKISHPLHPLHQFIRTSVSGVLTVLLPIPLRPLGLAKRK